MRDPSYDTGMVRLEREAEATHQQRLFKLLEAMPHRQTAETKALRSLVRRVVGDGQATEQRDGTTWRGLARWTNA